MQHVEMQGKTAESANASYEYYFGELWIKKFRCCLLPGRLLRSGLGAGRCTYGQLFSRHLYISTFFLCVSKYSHTSTHTSAHTLPKLIYLPTQTPCLIKILYNFEVAAPNYSHTLSHIPAHTLSKLIYPPAQYRNIFLHTFLFKQFPHQ